MRAQPHPLQGRKILILEDEAPIALSLASAVAQAGGIAVGPADQPDLFLAMDAVFPPALAADRRFREAVKAAHQALAEAQFADLLTR